jgi:hypothetical protein
MRGGSVSGSVGAPLREINESRLKALKMLRTIWGPEGRVAGVGIVEGIIGRETDGSV